MSLNSLFISIKAPHKLTIEYARLGNGPKLLYLTGGGTDIHFAQEFVEYLAQRYEIYTFSYPGFGKGSGNMNYSLVNFLSLIYEFTSAVKLGSFILVGQSFGAGLALAYASEHPEQIVGSVVAISPLILPMRKSLLQMNSDISRQYQLGEYKPDFSMNKKPSLFEKIRLMVNSARIFALTKQIDLMPYLSKLRNHVIGIVGENDLLVSPADQVKGLRLIPGVKILKYPDYGHNVMFTAKQDILNSILQS